MPTDGGRVGVGAAERIARRLRAFGCRHAFGIPGGEVLAMVEALRAAGIRVGLTRHENAAGFVAEGVHHADGAPAVLVTTLGPGLANAVNVVANAFQDRVPMIVLAGSVPAALAHRYTHQVLDHRELLASVTKAALRVEPGAADRLAEKALAIATAARPGPVLLDLPMDVQERDEPEYRPAPARRGPAVPAEGEALATARAWLAEAERPLAVAGLDVAREPAAPAVAAFCRRFGVPLVTTYKAKGVLDEEDPLALGGAGLSPVVDARLRPLFAAADCILLIGYDPIEMRAGWCDPWPADARVIELAAAPNHHFVHRARLEFVGDPAASLARLADGLEPRATWPEGEPARVRRALVAERRLDEAWGPAAVVDVLRRVLPPDAVVTTDSGAHRIVLSQAFTCRLPGTLLQSTGFCTMGCALPLAIGRKLAEPRRTVVATTGDGGLEMVLGELATLRDLALSLPIVVFADRELALIGLKQRSRGLPEAAVALGPTDWPAVAAAFGGRGRRVRDRETLAAELRSALARPGFTLIAAELEARDYEGRIRAAAGLGLSGRDSPSRAVRGAPAPRC